MSARHRQAKKRLYEARCQERQLERLVEAYDLVALDIAETLGEDDVIHANIEQARERTKHSLADVRAVVKEQETLIAAMPKRLESVP